MTKINLPPRKWYNLEKAIREIKKRTGEELDIEDLLHYWAIDKLDFSIYFKKYPVRLALGNLEFHTSENKLLFDYYQENEKEEIYLKDIFKLTYKPTQQFTIKNIKVTQTIKSKINLVDYYSMCGFLRILPDGFSLDPQEINNIFKKGVKFNFLSYLINPSEIEQDLIITLMRNTDDELYINLNEFYILENDLDRFLKGKAENEEKQNLINKAKNKGGRPANDAKELAIKLAQKAYDKYNQDIQRQILAQELAEFLTYKCNFNISEETIKSYLTELKIGNRKGKSRNLDFETILKEL